MKIGAITFHGAHNYGSVLQAYALKTYIEGLFKECGSECRYQVIDFRPPIQKELYGRPKPANIKSLLKYAMYSRYGSMLEIQDSKFEEFISDRLELTKELSSPDELPQIAEDFDILIAGSDQIWNVRAKDFSFAYLFEGCKGKKISYAASLGPLTINWDDYDRERFSAAVGDFRCISVREEKSRTMLSECTGAKKSIGVHADPTFLLSADEWHAVQSDMSPLNGEYILFYCLEPSADHLRAAKKISKEYGLPVVATRYRNKHDYFNSFIKRYDAGPQDFLSLIDHAKLVITSSFHGTAFSMIYGKPFYVIGGMNDGRIRNILTEANAGSNSIDLKLEGKLEQAKPVNVCAYIEAEKRRSRDYLARALGIKID